MDSHNSEQIDLAAYEIYKQTRSKYLRTSLTSLNEFEIERKINREWQNMTNKEKFPFVKLIEENPNLMERTCQANAAHYKN
jgi:hypothetical protein